VAGWVASIITGDNARMGCIANIVVGIIGAFIGGYLVRLVGFGPVADEFSIYSFIVAVVGAVVLLAGLRLLRGR
jgi:uncharacterized membrane protein YeaQ/YmgE (transglycosylase-associated protein family)